MPSIEPHTTGRSHCRRSSTAGAQTPQGDPDRNRSSGGHHRGHARLLDHDRDAHARIDTVWPANAPELHPRLGHAAHTGQLVATFVYSILALVVISPGSRGEFVPHLSITVNMALVVVDVGVLVLFIDHIAKSIQLPQVIASIARDLSRAIEADAGLAQSAVSKAGLSLSEVTKRLDEEGAVVTAMDTGYLQFVRIDPLIAISAETHSVNRLLHRPGHFVATGKPLAHVWPADAAPRIARALGGAHATGLHRTLTQDLSFAVEQLV